MANRVTGDVQQLCEAIGMESADGAELSDEDLKNGIERVLKQEGDFQTIMDSRLYPVYFLNTDLK